jgi:hypothetical protein
MAYDATETPMSTNNWFRLRSGDTDGTYTLWTDAEVTALMVKTTNNIERAMGIAFLALSNDPIRMVKMMDAVADIMMTGLAETYLARAQAHLA